MTRTWGLILLAGLALCLAAAPVLAPNDPAQQFAGKAYAPPMPLRVMDDGDLRRPFVYPMTVVEDVDRRERRFEERRDSPAALAFFSGGRVIVSPSVPWLPFGGDPIGRDLFSRLLWGGRLSVGVAVLAVGLTLALGTLAGGVAGFAGGAVDRVIMSVADFAIVLPLIYVVVTLRAAVMPLAPDLATVFLTMAVVMALASWPVPARAVRAVIAAERQKEYAEAAYSAGAGPLRILLRHLLPAAGGQVATHGILLFPAFIFAEATLSFVGLGFAEPSASWGVMLKDARSASVIDAPWLLAPAVAIVLAVLGARLLLAGEHQPEAISLS